MEQETKKVNTPRTEPDAEVMESGKETQVPSYVISKQTFSKFGAVSGALVIVFFLWMPPSAFFPPIPPRLTPAQVVKHYRDHEIGIKGGVALYTFVGFFMPIYVGTVSGQISRIPGIPKAVVYTQLAGGIMGGMFLVMPAYFFATTVHRLDRSPELTQLLDDLSFVFFAMPFTGILAQDLAFSYAILLDRRPKPLFPKWLALVTTGLTLTFWPAIGTHCVKSGAVAWNGGLTFWTAGVGGGVQFCIIAFYLFKAVCRTDLPPDGEVIRQSESNTPITNGSF